MTRQEIARHSLPEIEAPEAWELGKRIDQLSEIPSLIKLLIQHYEQLTEATEKIQTQAAPDANKAEQILSEQLENYHSGIKDAVSPDFIKILDKLLAVYPYETIINKDRSQQIYSLSLTKVFEDIELFWQRRILSTFDKHSDPLSELRREIAFITSCLNKIVEKSGQAIWVEKP